MKGVITAGGLGTRLYPLTHATNKHLLPVYDKPMIFYPINTLVDAGIEEIMIIVGGPYASHFVPVLKDGSTLGIKHLEFAYQEKESGIAQALGLAENFVGEDDVTVILGDNTTDANISKEVKNFKKGAKIFLKEVQDPKRFGVATFDSKDPTKIVKITEKPQNPDSLFAVTGLYIYDKHVFDIIKKIKPSKRGELEITDVNNQYIKKGLMKWAKLNGYWKDAGTFDTLLETNNYWAKKNKHS